MSLRIVVRTKDEFDGTYCAELLADGGEVLTRLEGYETNEAAMEAGEQAAALVAAELGKTIREE